MKSFEVTMLFAEAKQLTLSQEEQTIIVPTFYTPILTSAN